MPVQASIDYLRIFEDVLAYGEGPKNQTLLVEYAKEILLQGARTME